MKKSLLYLCALIGSMSLFTACNNDDNPHIPTEDVNAAYSSTDAENKLVLTYSEVELLGKEVVFNTIDGKSATLVLKGGALNLGGLPMSRTSPEPPSLISGVIPGEATTTLNVELASTDGVSYTFQGVDIKDGRTINYKGAVKKGELTLDLKVVMPANDLLGKWNLTPVVADDWAGANVSQPIYTDWKSGEIFNLIFGLGAPKPMPADALLSMATGVMPLYADKNGNELLLSVLQSITFKEDGNIVASYSDGKDLNNPTWTKSPVNIAQYYVRDNKVYLVLNSDMILGALTRGSSTRINIEPIIPGLIQDVLPMLASGIPLAYSQKDGSMKIYADTELVMKLMRVFLPLLEDEEVLAMIMESITSNPGFASYAVMVQEMLQQLPAVVEATTKFELGISLDKVN